MFIEKKKKSVSNMFLKFFAEDVIFSDEILHEFFRI